MDDDHEELHTQETGEECLQLLGIGVHKTFQDSDRSHRWKHASRSHKLL